MLCPDCESSLPAAQKPYREMGEFLKQQPRDIVFSLCQYGQTRRLEMGRRPFGGNSWRTTGDIVDTWSSMSGIGFRQDTAAPFAGPGHWNDPDMLIVGQSGLGKSAIRPGSLQTSNTRTSACVLCCLRPLLIGCDMTQLDPFTLKLLENDDVLAVDQDPMGQNKPWPVARVRRNTCLCEGHGRWLEGCRGFSILVKQKQLSASTGRIWHLRANCVCATCGDKRIWANSKAPSTLRSPASWCCTDQSSIKTQVRAIVGFLIFPKGIVL